MSREVSLIHFIKPLITLRKNTNFKTKLTNAGFEPVTLWCFNILPTFFLMWCFLRQLQQVSYLLHGVSNSISESNLLGGTGEGEEAAGSRQRNRVTCESLLFSVMHTISGSPANKKHSNGEDKSEKERFVSAGFGPVWCLQHHLYAVFRSAQKMSSSSPLQSGLSSKQVDKQTIFERLQKAKMAQEITKSASTADPVDSQTTTDYGSLSSGVPTTPTQTNYGPFPTNILTIPT
ncbi:hypothetical protein BDD12DRAFT_803972 [Trichophaea hybrida]|nr:hypothetical protein BDD12DRAFT_803972 [Trichophaea hybrida]